MLSQNRSGLDEQHRARQQRPPKVNVPNQAVSEENYSGPGTAKYLELRRFKAAGKAKGPQPSSTVDGVSAEAEFDFQSSNARFDKESFIRDLTSPRDAQDPSDAQASDSVQNPSPTASQPKTTKYDKTASFFDNISLDRDERGRRENRRGQNEETFGSMATGYTATNFRRHVNRGRRGKSGNQDGTTPFSPIRRNDQQSPKPSRSPNNGGRKGRSRRGRRGHRSNVDSATGRNSNPSSVQSAAVNNPQSL